VNFKIVDIFESVKDDIFSIQPYLQHDIKINSLLDGSTD